VKHYTSILDYVMELSNSSTALPVPIFDLPSSKMSIPVGVVIGTQVREHGAETGETFGSASRKGECWKHPLYSPYACCA